MKQPLSERIIKKEHIEIIPLIIPEPLLIEEPMEEISPLIQIE